MPNAEKQSSPKKKGCAVSWALLLVSLMLLFLAALSAPKFGAYRVKSRVASAVASAEGVRAALASVAAESRDNLYPRAAAITNDATLRHIVKSQGGTLPRSGPFTVLSYTTKAEARDYALRVAVTGVSPDSAGSVLLITPDGVQRCVRSTGVCH